MTKHEIVTLELDKKDLDFVLDRLRCYREQVFFQTIAGNIDEVNKAIDILEHSIKCSDVFIRRYSMYCDVTLDHNFGVDPSLIRDIDPLPRTRILMSNPLAEETAATVTFHMTGKEFKELIEAANSVMNTDIEGEYCDDGKYYFDNKFLAAVETLVQPWTFYRSTELD